MSAYDTVGSLAEALRTATKDLSRKEQDVEEFLATLFPGWRPRFPRRHGWRFTAPDSISIYDVIESPAAVEALQRAGFGRVTLHDHPITSACRCATHLRDR